MQYLQDEQLDIPLIPAGGIFTGSDAVRFLENGAAAVQVATRFTVARECGLPDDVKQEYFKANEDDIEVNDDFAHRLSDAHAEEQPRDRRRHPPQLRSLWLSARRQWQLRLHRRLQPRSGGASRRARRSR